MEISPYLKSHKFFDGLSEKAIEKLANCAAEVQFYAGQVIFKDGDPANRFYIVLSGKISLEVEVPGKANLEVQQLTDGELMGWSWLFEPKTWHFNARAIEFARAIVFDADKLLEIFDEDPTFGLDFVRRMSKVLAERLTASRLQMIRMHSN